MEISNFELSKTVLYKERLANDIDAIECRLLFHHKDGPSFYFTYCFSLEYLDSLFEDYKIISELQLK